MTAHTMQVFSRCSAEISYIEIPSESSRKAHLAFRFKSSVRKKMRKRKYDEI